MMERVKSISVRLKKFNRNKDYKKENIIINNKNILTVFV